jgi:2-polyprenyl-3-methyl-5-hydroxy-6-metoxy-1,4-benzoquinol methylase
MPAGFDTNDWQELLIVAAAIELGIFKELDREAATAPELARRLGYDQRAMHILLEALTDLDHLYQDGDRYHLSNNMRSVAADETSAAYEPFFILHQRNLIERWLTIPEVVRTGRQVERPYTSKRREVFIRSMHDASKRTAAAVVESCLKRALGARTVIDIGGGPGTYGREFARRGLKVTILDCPEVIEIMKPELSRIPEINLVAGDFNEALPSGPFDLAFMGNIFHIYGPQENALLLKRVRNSLSPRGTVAIVDIVRGLSSRAPLFAVTMLVSTNSGNTWTEDDYRNWLTGAGFGQISLEEIAGRDSQLILANRL